MSADNGQVELRQRDADRADLARRIARLMLGGVQQSAKRSGEQENRQQRVYEKRLFGAQPGHILIFSADAE